MSCGRRPCQSWKHTCRGGLLRTSLGAPNNEQLSSPSDNHRCRLSPWTPRNLQLSNWWTSPYSGRGLFFCGVLCNDMVWKTMHIPKFIFESVHFAKCHNLQSVFTTHISPHTSTLSKTHPQMVMNPFTMSLSPAPALEFILPFVPRTSPFLFKTLNWQREFYKW